MLYKIIFIAIICVFLSTLTKKYNLEISTLISVCGGVLIFILSVQELTNIFNELKDIYNFTDLNFDFLKIIFKVLAIGYVTEFTADIADDFGNSIISSKVIFGGKLVICGMTMPIIKELLEMLLQLL